MATLLVAVPVAGCADQSPPEGRMVCDHPSDCPSGWTCNLEDFRCYRSSRPDGGDDSESDGTSE
jgi:hypothetical protein